MKVSRTSRRPPLPQPAGAGHARRGAPRAGFALLTVLVVLLALLVLCAPFLLTARNVSKASFESSDRIQVGLALDAASRHARAELALSHPGVDASPHWDDDTETRIFELDPEFIDQRDARGVMWSVSAEDVAGKIDLQSASPQVLANLLGRATYLTRPVGIDDSDLPVADRGAFGETGWLWVAGEYIRFGALEERSFSDCLRGQGSVEPTDEVPDPCGPRLPLAHELGTPVIDPALMAVALWRVLDVPSAASGDLRTFDSIERLREVRELALESRSPVFEERSLELLRRFVTVHADVRGERRWQAPVRVMNPISAGQDCRIEVESARWINVGSTIQISNGRATEYGVVQRTSGGQLWLEQELVNDYEAFEAELRVLARRAVNLNTASAEVLAALFENLKLNGVNSRVTASEARELAALIVESRPLESHEDFLRRVVLPAAAIEVLPADAPVRPEALGFAGSGSSQGAGASAPGVGGIIDAYDALAIYRNGLNANDGGLAFSTMPYRYTTRDVFLLDLSAAVNAPSGVLRAQGQRQELRLVVPQEELLQVWATQADFDESLRIDREAPWWASGPRATSRWDNGASPPSRLWSHMGVLEGSVYLPGVSEPPEGYDATAAPQPERVFAESDDPELGYAALWPARTTVSQGEFVEHFDHDTTDPEGRYLPDQTEFYAADDSRIQLADSNSYMRALRAEFWLKPEQLGDGVLLDAGGSSQRTDRVTVAIEAGELVLSVRDATEDHGATVFEERATMRLPLAGNPGPGLAEDIWSHVEIDVRGNSPDRMTMLVDGQARGVRTPGLSRLVSQLGSSSTTIAIEDGDGFPERGVVLIGEELIEYRKSGPNTLDCSRALTGANGGHGGRLAREISEPDPQSGIWVPVNALAGKLTNHPADTPVALYGYSAPLLSNISTAQSSLSSDLGAFAVGVITGVQPDAETITADYTFNNMPLSVELGTGLDAATSGSQVTAIDLGPADAGMPVGEVLAAFSPDGGYALLAQASIGGVNGSSIDAINGNSSVTFTGGVEVIRYSGRSGSTLFIAERGILSLPPGGTPGGNSAGTSGAFVVDWSITVGGQDLEQPPAKLRWDVFVVPLSIPVPGGAFENPPQGVSGFAQITRVDQPELTEWVRYDEVLSGGGGSHLVRNELGALLTLRSVLISQGQGPDDADPGGPPGGGPGGGGGGQIGGGQVDGGGGGPGGALAGPLPGQGGGLADWSPEIGVPEDESYPLTRAAREALQFRGVFATHSHDHPAGTQVLPCFRSWRSGPVRNGRPGRFDAGYLIDAAPGLPDQRAWSVQLHRAHIPTSYLASDLDWSGSAPVTNTVNVIQESRVDQRAVYFALSEPAPVPVAGDENLPNVTPGSIDVRQVSRLTAFPSGELPRTIDRITVGSSVAGGNIPSATLDELVIAADDPDNVAAAVLLNPLGVGQSTADLRPSVLRLAHGDVFVSGALSQAPAAPALARIGEEIVCYSSLDASSGSMEITEFGRGLLGTEEAHHQPGESVIFFGRRRVAVLASDVSATDANLPYTSTLAFPSSGTLRIGDELLHYTRLVSDAFEMPSASEQPGLKDARGRGIFRGRFGSVPAGHVFGEPLILHPFRYWDRGAELADAPELSYFGLTATQPSAYWTGVFWDEQSTLTGGAYLEVLQRSDETTPWDAEPTADGPLRLYRRGMPEGQANPIMIQSDRCEWRVFVRHNEGSFDWIDGASHGWKESPRLKLFGVQYLAPDLLLERVDW